MRHPIAVPGGEIAIEDTGGSGPAFDRLGDVPGADHMLPLRAPDRVVATVLDAVG
jgi:hypothetical protein